METVLILRGLWRRRLLVAFVALLAIAVGFLLAYRPSFPPQSRSYTVGVANARILVDTPESQVIDISPKGSDGLGSKASVLANLMVDGEVKTAIARKAGLNPRQLIAATEMSGGAESVMPAGLPPTKAYMLTTGVLTNSDLVEMPIIKVHAQAPDARRAAALANAAIAGLGDYLDAKAVTEHVTSSRRLRVTGLGAAQASNATRGPGRLMSLMMALFIFAVGCGLITALTALASGWREVEAAEAGGWNTLPPDDGLFDEFDDSMLMLVDEPADVDDLDAEPIAREG